MEFIVGLVIGGIIGAILIGICSYKAMSELEDENQVLRDQVDSQRVSQAFQSQVKLAGLGSPGLQGLASTPYPPQAAPVIIEEIVEEDDPVVIPIPVPVVEEVFVPAVAVDPDPGTDFGGTGNSDMGGSDFGLSDSSNSSWDD